MPHGQWLLGVQCDREVALERARRVAEADAALRAALQATPFVSAVRAASRALDEANGMAPFRGGPVQWARVCGRRRWTPLTEALERWEGHDHWLLCMPARRGELLGWCRRHCERRFVYAPGPGAVFFGCDGDMALARLSLQ